MPGISDLVERVNQGILALRLEYNVEVDRGTSGRMNDPDSSWPCFIHITSQSGARGVARSARGTS